MEVVEAEIAASLPINEDHTSSWPMSERLRFSGRLRHGLAGQILSQKIIDAAETALLNSLNCVALDRMKTAVEAIERTETQRTKRAADLIHTVATLGHPLDDAVMDENAQVVHLAEALAADVKALRKAVGELLEAIAAAEALLSEKADTPLPDAGSTTVNSGHPIVSEADLFSEAHPSEAGVAGEVDSCGEKTDTAVAPAADHTDGSGAFGTAAIIDSLPAEEEGAGHHDVVPTTDSPSAYVDACAHYRNSVALSGPGHNSGRRVVQVVDMLLGGVHTPLFPETADISHRRAFAAFLSTWYALAREINVSDNVARALQRLGCVVKSRLAAKRGVDLGDADAVRMFDATVIPTIGLFGAAFVPLLENERQSIEIAVVWTHPQRAAQVLWRLPPGDALRVVLVMATLDDQQWRDVDAALDGRGASVVFDTGFAWWIGSKAATVIDGTWKSRPNDPVLDAQTEAGPVQAGGAWAVLEASSAPTAQTAVQKAPCASFADSHDDTDDIAAAEILPRRYLPGKPWCWSPLTEKDEKAILAGPKHVWAVVGSRAAGLDHVSRFLSLAKPGVEIHEVDDVSTPKGLRTRLQQIADLRSGQHLALVRPQAPMDRAHWGAVSGVAGGARGHGAKGLRVVVLINPWLDPASVKLAAEGLLSREIGIAGLSPLNDVEISEWVRVASSKGAFDVGRALGLTNTFGGWTGLLSETVDSVLGGRAITEPVLRDVGVSPEVQMALQRLPSVLDPGGSGPPRLVAAGAAPAWLMLCGAVRLLDDGGARVDRAVWHAITTRRAEAA